MCRLSCELSIGKQLGRLLKRLPGKRMSSRQAAKVFLRFKGEQVQPDSTVQTLAPQELLDWVAQGSEGAACIFDVHTHD